MSAIRGEGGKDLQAALDELDALRAEHAAVVSRAKATDEAALTVVRLPTFLSRLEGVLRPQSIDLSQQRLKRAWRTGQAW